MSRALLWAMTACVAVLGCDGAPVPADAGPPDAGPPPAPWAVSLDWIVEAVAVDGRGNVYASDGATHAWTPAGDSLFTQGSGTGGWHLRHGLAALVDGGVVAVSDRGVIRMDPDGTERWRFSTFLDVHAVAVSRDEVAVLTSISLVVLDLADGTERWRAAADDETAEIETARERMVAARASGGWVTTPPLVAFSAEGEREWVAEIPVRELHALTTARDGTTLVAGVYERAVDLGLGPLPEPLQFDPFVALFDDAGRPKAALTFPGVDFEYPYGAASDGATFLVTGHYGEFGNGIDIGDTHLKSAGGRAAFLARIDTDGAVLSAASISGDGMVVGRAVAWSPRASRWVIGGMYGGELTVSDAVLPAREPWGGFVWAGAD